VDEVLLGPNCNLVGKSLVEAETRKQHGLLIVAIKPKSGPIMFNPGSEIVLQSGDTVIVMGRLEDIDRFRADHRV
jgi:voltage-gated potassium channel